MSDSSVFWPEQVIVLCCPQFPTFRSMFALTGAVSILAVIQELRDLELWDEVFGWVILIIDEKSL